MKYCHYKTSGSIQDNLELSHYARKGDLFKEGIYNKNISFIHLGVGPQESANMERDC
jgi:hypothetical protein